MTATEERTALMAMAQELHETMREHDKQINRVINALLGEGDRLLVASADEKQAGLSVTKKAVVYTSGAAEAPGKRKCGICHKPGHRRETCPDAHIAYKAERTGKTGKKAKLK